MRPVLTYLIPLVVKSDPRNPGVARAPKADNLLRMAPFKHPHTSVLSTC